MTTALGIAAESAGDAALLTDLVDRAILADTDWITADVLADYRRWCGVGNESWLDVHGAFRRARDLGYRVYGHFDGRPGAADAQTARALLLLFAHEAVPPAAVVLARDTDGDPDRAVGLKQAVDAGTWPFRVLAALAHPELEAWRIAAWTPADDADRACLAVVRERVGFDPTATPERLTSRRQTDPKDAKRVLAELCERGRSARERWADASIDDLAACGHGCGLAGFVDAVRRDLIPLVTAAR